MVAETKSGVLQRDAELHDMEEALSLKLELKMETLFLSKTQEMKNELLEAIRSMAPTMTPSEGNRNPVQNSSTTSSTPNPNSNYQDPIRTDRSYNQSSYSGLTRLGKIDFPRFNGDRYREWLFKVEEFFVIDRTPYDVRIQMVALHFDSHASTFHQSLVQSAFGGVLSMDWEAYKVLLKEIFEDVLDDPIAELKQLHERNGIVEYHEKFDLIKTIMNLSEEVLMSAYLAGLRLDTQIHIRMFKPRSVRHCLLLGRLYERAHPKNPASVNWSRWKSNNNYQQLKGYIQNKKEGDTKMGNQMVNYNPKSNIAQPRKFLSQEEMSARRAKGLCYHCDEKYTPDHYLQHKKTQLYAIEVNDEEEEFEDAMQGDEEEEMRPVVYVSAVSGVADYTTMKIRGIHNKKPVFLLVDSGSTHNFIDVKVAERLGCKPKISGVTKVEVAHGRTLKVSGLVKQFQWSVRHYTFQADFMIIPLGNCDMVLGIQWLKTLGRISWDFNTLDMSFTVGKQRIALQGIKPGSVREVKTVNWKKRQEEHAQFSMIFVHNVEAEEEFEDIFEEPTALPPFRKNHNHKIPLLEGSNPVNHRPYRYALYQKNEIDNIVKDLLDKGTIQNSSSSYASPVVLVKKKDDTWHLCVDYRGLNGMTVKDRFPIPLIEDLMDELGG
ncbi:hypothetical protein V5N11_003190 [Cardamine amara subsp. amara]|uniref:Retrotransposon gag domain-containing protein n=1 Tax=Cardamine amara subsp. amara TaxID=228776 RepID=A0ABD0ZAK1_CARAN